LFISSYANVYIIYIPHMLSIKALKNFFTTNLTLFAFGSVEYIGLILLNGFSPIIQFIITFIILLARNFILLYFITIAIKDKKYVSDRRKEPEEQYRGEFVKNVITTTFTDAITMTIAKNYLLHVYDTRIIHNYLYDIMMFIPQSFVFELVFDFFHYWSHRCAHSKYLYSRLHKHHHKHHDVSPIVTFYQDPLDMIFSNTIPVLITLYLMSNMLFLNLSLFSYAIMSVYKVSVEIYGHSGKHTPPEFVQCIWLPRYLGIVLTSENHSHHHMFNNCNYSKRFSLWDKLYGTFRY
jgi:sterol desaturase/sphingolipid hydroxylase (fatty acid hydroxylase superfamily)